MIWLGVGFLAGTFVGLVFSLWYPSPASQNPELQKYLAFHLACTNRMLLKEQTS